jgi:hypothetical protein
MMLAFAKKLKGLPQPLQLRGISFMSFGIIFFLGYSHICLLFKHKFWNIEFLNFIERD